MTISNVEIQDSNSNVYYPHTDSNVVKHGNTTVAETLTQNALQLDKIPNNLGGFIFNYADLVVDNDWSIAMQTMIDEGETINLPKGTFNFDTTIKFRNSFSISGISRSESILNYTGTGNAFENFDLNVNVQNPQFRNLTLKGQGKTISLCGINLTNVDHGIVYNCFIVSFADDVILSDNFVSRCYYNTITRNYLTGCTNGIRITGHKPNANLIENNRISSGESGIFVDIDRSLGHGPVNTLSFRKNNFANLTHGIRVQYILSSSMEDNRFEEVDYGIYWDTTTTANHRYITVKNNDYDNGIQPWLGSPHFETCLISENRRSLGLTWQKNNTPYGISVFNDITDSTDILTGSAVFKGGVAIAKNINVGANMTVGETLKVKNRQLKSIQAYIKCYETYSLDIPIPTMGFAKISLSYTGSRANITEQLYMEGVAQTNSVGYLKWMKVFGTVVSAGGTGAITIAPSSDGLKLEIRKTAGSSGSGGYVNLWVDSDFDIV